MPAVGVLLALPFGHARWGEPYPGDGQDAFGMLIVLSLCGFVAAVVHVGVGSLSLSRYLLRRRRPGLTVLADWILFAVVAGVLAYAGATARYSG
ncbi:MAG TPA: hypothetical protein VNO52_00635 [Methylomirabilota bacterium]|nr:hypothetical protein [Methylomirabilota bacterium]